MVVGPIEVSGLPIRGEGGFEKGRQVTKMKIRAMPMIESLIGVREEFPCSVSHGI